MFKSSNVNIERMNEMIPGTSTHLLLQPEPKMMSTSATYIHTACKSYTNAQLSSLTKRAMLT